MFSYKQVILFIIYTLIVFGSGWKANVYYEGYKLSELQKIEKVVSDGFSQIQQNNSKNYEDIQTKLDEKKIEIIETKIPMIIDRPIYFNNCMDQDGVDVLLQYKKESIKIIRGENNAK